MNLSQEKELFSQIADASKGLFTATEIQYFFENVLPQIDDEDNDGSFLKMYKIAQETNARNLERLIDHYNGNMVRAISCLTFDTAFYNVWDDNDCLKLASEYDEEIGEIIKSNVSVSTKLWLVKQHEPHSTTLVFMQDDWIVSYLNYDKFNADEFLEIYDGLIAKAILQRNLQEKLTEKGSKSKSTKI